MFDVGDIVKVKKDSSLRKRYAFDNDRYFIVLSVSASGPNKSVFHVKVLPLEAKDLPISGQPDYPATEFYHIAEMGKRRVLLLERDKRFRPRPKVDTTQILLFLDRLRQRQRDFMNG